MPSQPCSASFCQNPSVIAAGSAIRWRTNCVVHSLSKKRRALSRSISCSSVNPISISQSARLLSPSLLLGPHPSLPRRRGGLGRGLPLRQTEDALADDVALDLAGAA